MSTTIPEQIRQLTAAFDELVGDITIAEVSGRVEVPYPFHDVEHPPGDALAFGHGSSRRRLLSVVAAGVLLVVGVVSTLAWVGRDRASTFATPLPSATGSATASVAFGQFVWPAPPRNFATPEKLVGAFATEVLGWQASDFLGAVTGEPQPQVFTIVNSSSKASVALVAIPSPNGWGFVQIGKSMSASGEQPGDLVLTVPVSDATQSRTVVIRLSDGTTRESTDLSGRVVFSGVRLQDLISALAVDRDANGRAVSVAGGVFEVDSVPPATDPEPTAAAAPGSDFAGGVDGPVMFAPGPPSSGGMMALIQGVLVRDGDCLFAGDGAPGSRVTILWPFGTTWDDAAQAVVVSDGTRIPVGSAFSAGGGSASREVLQLLPDDAALAERADACAEGENKEIALVQHSISVIEAVPPTGT